MFIIVSALVVIVGIASLFLKDKENKYKDIIIPIEGSKFKGNI